ncbi:hypothetical protein DWF00_11440 [Bosea caraganae]|uniref:Uncharacterized protein n=1 Tax=Bosea caraganae TaxID=2763117 RepID=A0A370LDE9_9HYPH|nr:hypothetical protein [Bosea caraganae]RDJ27550.1 hypothetical protein DWF00_11440 [Bosea caraganae]RDJ29565.1 hypothetical protein DWE98_03210 [Bosea caraganae]
MMRFAFILAGLTLSLAVSAHAQAPAAPKPTAAAVTADEPVPRAERAKARQDCLAENVALSGDDLRQAMRDCIQGRFPGVQLYARDGLTRDGKPTAVAARSACKTEADERSLSGTARRDALTSCFKAKRPDLAARAECRKESRAKGLDGEELRKAITECARATQS